MSKSIMLQLIASGLALMAVVYPLVGVMAALIGVAAVWVAWRESRRLECELREAIKLEGAQARAFSMFMH